MKAPKTKATEDRQTEIQLTDPLYVIFEQHLFNFQDPDLDRKTFVGNVLNDYFSYLRKSSMIIPKAMEASIVEELQDQVQTMLIKKIYGCFSLQHFQEKLSSALKKEARSRYKSMIKK